MVKDKILVLAYMGTGKTELERRYQNVSDVDFQDYKFIYDESIRHLPLEKRKGNVLLRTENPDYPENFINAIFSELELGKVVVSPFIEHVFRAINSDTFQRKAEGTRVILVFPKSDNFEEYVERFKKRGNNDAFIERRRREFPTLIDLFENVSDKDYEKIQIKPNQFLAEALSEYGINLEQAHSREDDERE